jgi:hypothetical protein
MHQAAIHGEHLTGDERRDPATRVQDLLDEFGRVRAGGHGCRCRKLGYEL